jgi:L-amino acid N-acyltransferase YncA
LLQDLFSQIDLHQYNSEQLSTVNYAVVGQLCVAKNHRGLGLAQQLYAYYQSCLKDKYRYLITDIDAANIRSLKVHLKTGFEIIGELHYGGSNWHIVLWNWNN